MSGKRVSPLKILQSLSNHLGAALPAFLAVVLLLSVFPAEAKLRDLDGVSPSRMTVSLTANDPGGVSLKAVLSGLQAGRAATKGGEFESLDIPGEGFTTQVGRPRLPVIRRLVEIPLGADAVLKIVSASVEEFALEDLGLKGPILPLQPPVPKIPGAAEQAQFVIDEQHYRSGQFWPPELVRVRDAGLFRETRLALVEIFPVRYNPGDEKVRICSTVEFELAFPGADHSLNRAHKDRYANTFTTRWTSSELFIQTDPQPSPMEGWAARPVGYLIVVGDDLYEAILPLAEWKSQQGFEVTLVKTSHAGDDKTEIQGYIQEAYDGWEIPPTFVLLVGDVDRLPTFNSSGIATDLFYATMNQGDSFPDIQIGRLSAADSVQLAGVVKKIVDYEKGLWEVEDGWTRRGYFMATNDSWYHNVAEGTQEYSMRLARAHGMICDSLYAYYGTGTPVSMALNDGRSVAVYTGHGSFYGWSGPAFSQNDVQALHNGEMYPLVCSHACMTGGYHKAVCFGETWLRAEGKGSAAFWGASVSSYWDEDDILQKRMFDALFDSSMSWLSGMMDRAKIELWTHYGGEGLSENYLKMYNLLGDPSMHLWTRPPKSLLADHADQLPLGSSSFTVKVWERSYSGPPAEDHIKALTLLPVDDALATLSFGEDRYGMARTRNGLVSVKLDPSPIEEGTMEVTVSKMGYRPHLGITEVSASGPFLMCGDHLVDDAAGGNGDGQVNAGETVHLEVALENWGNESARAVTAILTENDPYVQIGRSSASFGSIPAKGSGLSVPPYECHISEFCPSGYQIAFAIQAEDSLGRRWRSDFEVQVVTPDLRFSDYQVLDPAPGGNGNGVAEFGEIVDLHITLCNEGLGSAKGITAELISADSHIRVLSASSSFGDLAPDAEVSGDPAYQVEILGGGEGLLSCPLALEMAAAGDYQSTDTLSVIVGAPGLNDNMDAGMGGWTHQAIGGDYVDHWHLSEEKSHSLMHSWKCGSTGTGTYSHYENGALISRPILLAESSTLSFWHWIEAEDENDLMAWDGGIVEISGDDGLSWEQIAPVDGYPHSIYPTAPSAGCPFPEGTPCFSGAHDWNEERFDLSAYSGVVRIRFRFGSDQYTEGEGWYIDDVMVVGSRTSSRYVPEPRALISEKKITLLWAPASDRRGGARYEIYRSDRPEALLLEENLVAVVSAPEYVDHLDPRHRAGSDLYYAVVYVDAAGRRWPVSRTIGVLSRQLR